MSEAPVPSHSESQQDRLAALADNRHRSAIVGDLIDDRYRFELQHTYRSQDLEWTGPIAFARTYGAVRGTDHDLADRWGSSGAQQLRLRVEYGSRAGLLYVYDQTWDEYAVIGRDVPLAAVEDAFARGRRVVEYPSVEGLLAVLPHVPAGRPSQGPEL